MSLTINVDMDGVVYDFNAAITSAAELRLGRKLPPYPTTWSMWELWGISRSMWYSIFHESIRNSQVFDQRELDIEGAVDGLKKLIKAGHRVRIVTSKKLRFPESTAAAQIQVIRWLKHHELLNHVELVFAHDKQGYLADVVVDDKPTLKWAQRGALNLLFDQPWNAAVHEDAYRGPLAVVRTYGWHDVLDEIAELDGTPELKNDLGEGAGGG